MKERLLQIMKWQGMTQNEFAAAIGISPASLSSIINGHNNPTIKYIYAINNRFPEINQNWLIFGKGEMLGASSDGDGSSWREAPDVASLPHGTSAQPSLFDSPMLDVGVLQASTDNVTPTSTPIKHAGKVQEMMKNPDRHQRRIKEIRIFFDDGTYETFPGKA